MLSTTLPAHAGHWTIDHVTINGSNTFTSDAGFTETDPWRENGDSTDTSFDVYHGGGRQVHACSNEGTFTTYVKWVADNPSDMPVSNAWVQYEVSATATASGYESFNLANLQADDGLKDPLSLDVEYQDPDPVTEFNEGVATSSGTHAVLIPFTSSTQAGQLIALPPVSMSEVGCDDDDYAFNGFSFSVSVIDPQKSVMIAGLGNVFTNGQWNGAGDKLFDNYEEYIRLSEGRNLGSTANWSASLVGSLWPTQADYDAGHVSREWYWYSDPLSDSGDTFDIHTFDAPRPHVDWPYNYLTVYVPADFLHECQDGPPTQTTHINLHLIDTDLTGSAPWFNFDNTANYYPTFHNENESPVLGTVTNQPPNINQWQILTIGGQDITVGGYVNNWSPNFYYSWDAGVGYTFGETAASATDGSSAGIYMSVTPLTVPGADPAFPGQGPWRGVVYYRVIKQVIPFTFRKYSDSGEIFQYNPDGTVNPWSNTVVRTENSSNPIETRIFLFPPGYVGFPSTMDVDPPGYDN
jgi:hypothetical protein